MKKTEGYITDDGTFFESETEAVLHEAESRLRGALSTNFPEANPDMFLALVFQLALELRNYLDAHAAADTAKRNQQAEDEDGAGADDSASAKVDTSTGHVSSAEEDLEGLLKLPTRRPSDVPDVGRGPRTKKVPDRRQKHGA